MTFRVPKETRTIWKAKQPRKIAMSYEHAAAIVAEGLARGTRRHRSIALGVAAQFEFTLRQIDVIGEWEKIARAQGVTVGAIIDHGQAWRPGLRFEDFAGGVLDLTTSKTSTAAVFDVTAYPLFQQALAAVPEDERKGPLVVDESGTPIRRRYYQELYREIADAAKVPVAWVMHLWSRKRWACRGT
jgi:hypothetical protein